MLRIIRRTFSVFFTIYIIGTIGGVVVCLLEGVNKICPKAGIRFYNYSRLPLWEGGIILASNHPSWLDVIIIPLLYFPWWFRSLFRRTIVVANSPVKLLKGESLSAINGALNGHFEDVPFSTPDKHNLRRFWWILEGWNIFINRGKSGGGERLSAFMKAKEVLKRGGRIVLFPGGGRDYKGDEESAGIYDIETRQMILRAPKQGLGLLVQTTGATIVPIRLKGTEKVWPNEEIRWISVLLFVPRIFRHAIEIRIGEPIRLPKGTSHEIVFQEYVKAQISLYREGR